MSAYTTLEAARAAYLANADYADGAGDVTKAQAFRSACRALLVLMPATAGQGGSSVTMSVYLLQDEVKKVESFLGAQAAASAPRTTYADVSEFRS